MNITKTTEDMHDSIFICMEVPGRNKIGQLKFALRKIILTLDNDINFLGMLL